MSAALRTLRQRHTSRYAQVRIRPSRQPPHPGILIETHSWGLWKWFYRIRSRTEWCLQKMGRGLSFEKGCFPSLKVCLTSPGTQWNMNLFWVIVETLEKKLLSRWRGALSLWRPRQLQRNIPIMECDDASGLSRQLEAIKRRSQISSIPVCIWPCFHLFSYIWVSISVTIAFPGCIGEPSFCLTSCFPSGARLGILRSYPRSSYNLTMLYLALLEQSGYLYCFPSGGRIDGNLRVKKKASPRFLGILPHTWDWTAQVGRWTSTWGGVQLGVLA
ncbi:hypothetical protein EDC04DRAFT_2625476 [Pisolithus marmoratus]|nr:hypothetical protein EDC04DRAFT_2625476 [Pisolithus marmoratus]